MTTPASNIETLPQRETRTVATTRPSVGERLVSIDVVRGLVMVLMAIDHVRVYAGVPAGGDTAGVFFTRWVTHFCAPAFVFLAGTGAFLHGRKLGDTGALARYLVLRGLLLVVLELTVIRASWTFNFEYSQFVLAGVIWMLGWSMVMMGALVWLPTRVIAVIGLLLIFAQQAVVLPANVLPDTLRASSWSWMWDFIYWGIHTGDAEPPIAVLYTIVPWIGVMATGYAFGALMLRTADERRMLFVRIGLAATALFVVGATLQLDLGGGGENPQPALFRVLNQNKYPASQLFLLMTLGPMIALLPFAERARGPVGEFFATIGRVPMFYYLLHIPLIHALALLVTFAREGAVFPERYATAPYASVPEEFRWSLPLLYAVFVVAVAILYGPCRWYAGYKSRRRGGWTSYL